MPHSEIPGSKPVRGSPRLIAAYHVLHRLSAPRHPPDTLLALDSSSKSENGRAEALARLTPGSPPRQTNPLIPFLIEKTSFASNTSGNPRSGGVHDWYALVTGSNDGPEVSFKPGVRSGRDRMRFLFTMSDGLRAAPVQRRSAGPPSVAARACAPLLEDRPKRARPAAVASPCDLQTDISSDAAPSRLVVQDFWWSQTGSNRRPHACKARALPTELWPLGGGRA